MTRPARRPRVSHREVVTEAQSRPGEWVLVGPYTSGYSVRGVASAIRNGRRDMTIYKPIGAYETRIEPGEFDTELYVRYLGGEA